ncbi:MAG: AMP-binding protein [Propionivibrio sp.]|nr:AMP-binding protein [Propionivibrio sp.]
MIKVLRNRRHRAGHCNPDDECAAGEAGCVWRHHAGADEGLLHRDDPTAQAVIDGWFLTGDIGFIDEHGRLVLRGRERDGSTRAA